MTYGLFLARSLPTELQRDANWPILAFDLVFTAFAAGIVTAVVVVMPARIVMNLILKERHYSHHSEIIAITILLIFIVAYAFEVRRGRLNLAPPGGVATLSPFSVTMPSPRRLQLIQSEGQNRIAWTGDFSGPCDLVPGPSC